MKILIPLLLSLSVFSCGMIRNYARPLPSAHPQSVLNTAYGEKETPPGVAVKGWGYVTKSGVVLHKNLAVNYAIGNCRASYKKIIFSFKGALRESKRCSSEKTSRYKLFIRPIEKGKTIKASMRSRIAGSSDSNSLQRIRFNMNRASAGDQCFFITTKNGSPVPVRPGTSIESYLFSNPLLNRNLEQRHLNAAVREAEGRIKRTEKTIASDKNYLKKTASFQKGQCIALKQGSLPSKPKGMPYAEAQSQAEMACADMLVSRHEARAVYEAFGAIGRRDLMRKHMTWAKTPPPSCARVQFSQFDNFVCDFLGAFTPHAFRSCVQDAFASCKATVTDQCQGGIRAWRGRVNEITRKPERNRAACQQRKESLAHETGTLRALKKHLKKARLTAQSSIKTASLERIDLEQARCAL